ncbi:MAG: serine--tRNA ligase [Oscillospiraceae bacterium]|jgi:seryl-tRNA synthetase|nr:serine--tRNA ligase [Oscillospiraceae bacterium]
MLDIGRIRKEPREVEALLARRGYTVNFDELLAMDAQKRAIGQEGDALKARRNQLSAQVPRMKKNGEDTTALFDEVRQIGENIKAIDAQIDALDQKISYFVACLPNLPDADVEAGGKENNRVLHQWGEKPAFDFEPKNHVDLAESLHLIDYPRGAKLGGAGKWVYTGDGALLEWALLNYFIETHLKDGYQFMLVPHILNYEAGFTAGQFPKFEEDVFWIGEREGKNDQFVLPTAETALVNLHRGEILQEDELPKKYFAYTPCYRKEAGSYRAEERGMIRGNQFNKVEMVQYTLPEQSPAAFMEMVGKAEALVQGLGLHYQLSKLAAGDCSASMARTYDIEVWIPSMGIYKEVSSASNANDYQARRGAIRVKRKESGKNEFVHMLNASGLATSRIFPAILEQFQQADGSVKVPAPLVKWMGKEIIAP